MSTVFPDDPGAPGGQPQPPTGYPGDPGTPVGQPPPPPPPGPQQQQQPPQPSLSQSRQQRMQSYQNLITNFTFSLGSGLLESARTQGGPRNRTMAGVGAALMAPQYLQEAQQKYKMQQLQMQEAQQKLTAGQLVPVIDQTTGAEIPGQFTTQGQSGVLGQRERAAAAKAKEDADREAAKQAELNRKFKASQANLGLDENGQPLPEEALSPKFKQQRTDAQVRENLQKAQQDTTETQAALNRARAAGIPGEIALKQKQYDLAVKRQAATEDIARQNLGLHAEEVQIKKTATENNTPQAKLAAGLYKDATAAGVSYASLQGLVDQTRKNPESASVNDNAMLDQFYNIVKPDKGGRFTIAERTGIRNVGTLEERAKVWGQQLGDRGFFTDQTRQEILDAAKIVLDAKRGASTQQKPQPGPNAAPASGRPVYKLNPATGMPELVNK